MRLIQKEAFYKIKKACIEIRKILGNGFLEKIYERALSIELINRGFKVETQKPIEVQYKGETIGEYCADMVVNDQIIIELKCAEHIAQFHKAQLLNYLKATGYELGVLINFPNRATGFDIERVPNFIENAAEASEQIE